MKIKIIKRADRETAMVKDSSAIVEPKRNHALRGMTEAVNSWIDDSRKRRETDAALFRKLFKEEYCS